MVVDNNNTNSSIQTLYTASLKAEIPFVPSAMCRKNETVNVLYAVKGLNQGAIKTKCTMFEMNGESVKTSLCCEVTKSLLPLNSIFAS